MTTRFATILLALSACGAPQAPQPIAKHSPPADASAPAVVDAGEPVESLDALASRGAAETPLMRESQRVADATKPYEVRATDKDVCVRALFAANAPAKAWFEDDTKSPRGDVASASKSSLVPPKGPACAKKGETLKLVIEGATTARAVIWQSP